MEFSLLHERLTTSGAWLFIIWRILVAIWQAFPRHRRQAQLIGPWEADFAASIDNIELRN